MSNAEPPTRARHWWWTLLQVALLATTLWLVGRALARQWSDVRAVARDMHVDWSAMLLSGAIVLAVHASLIQSWRMLLGGWGSRLPFAAAVRIWTISNLGKYLPLKVWSIGAMGILSRREGASGVAAIGAALLGALLNVGAGFGVIALSGASVLRTINPAMRTTAVFGSVAFVAGVLALPWLLPPILTRAAVWRGFPPLEQHLSARTIWSATLVNATAWIGYGVAFMVFAHGVTPQIAGAPLLFVAVYAVSYLSGYLMIFAPGGLVVREAVMAGLLVTLGAALQPDAILLSLASRVWLTVIEVLPGLVALLLAPAAWRAALRGAD